MRIPRLFFVLLALVVIATSGEELDSDSDGVPDHSDACPHNPTKTVMDDCGCEVDKTEAGVW